LIYFSPAVPDFAPDGNSPLVPIVRMLGDGSVQLIFTGRRAGLDYANSVRFYLWEWLNQPVHFITIY